MTIHPSDFKHTVKEKKRNSGNMTIQKSKSYTHKNITFISNDGHKCVLKTEVAMQSRTIEEMLTGPNGTYDDKVEFHGLSSDIMKLLCRYLQYKYYYTSTNMPLPGFPIQPDKANVLRIINKFLRI